MCVGGNQLDISVFTTLHVDDDYYTVKRDFYDPSGCVGVAGAAVSIINNNRSQ